MLALLVHLIRMQSHLQVFSLQSKRDRQSIWMLFNKHINHFRDLQTGFSKHRNCSKSFQLNMHNSNNLPFNCRPHLIFKLSNHLQPPKLITSRISSRSQQSIKLSLSSSRASIPFSKPWNLIYSSDKTLIWVQQTKFRECRILQTTIISHSSLHLWIPRFISNQILLSAATI